MAFAPNNRMPLFRQNLLEALDPTVDPMAILARTSQGGNFTRNTRVGKRNSQNHSQRHSQRQSRGAERGSQGRGRGRGFGGRGRGRGMKKDGRVQSFNKNQQNQPGRMYIPEVYFNGEIEELKGKWGFIVPEHAIGHPKFNKKLFFHSNDIECEQHNLPVGTKVQFYLYVDQRGLGAHRITCPHIAAIAHLRFILSIEKSYVGGLIGKKAENIKKLCKQTGAQIKVQRDSGLSNQDYQLCVITGEPEKMIEACYAVALHLATASQSLNAKLTFIIPTNHIGRLIGRKGANIKSLQAKFQSINFQCGKSNDTPIYVDDEPHRTFQCFGPNGDMKGFIEDVAYQLLSFDGYKRPKSTAAPSSGNSAQKPKPNNQNNNENDYQNNNNSDVIEIF